jgi:hypothetical protein
VGVSGEFVLEGAGYWKSKARKRAAWERNSFQLVIDLSGFLIELNQEPLLALLDMHFGRGVEETETAFGISDVYDPAEIERPESERVRFYGYDLPRHDQSSGIGNAHPAKVEHGPLFKGPPGCGEAFSSVSNAGS